MEKGKAAGKRRKANNSPADLLQSSALFRQLEKATQVALITPESAGRAVWLCTVILEASGTCWRQTSRCTWLMNYLGEMLCLNMLLEQERTGGRWKGWWQPGLQKPQGCGVEDLREASEAKGIIITDFRGANKSLFRALLGKISWEKPKRVG